MLHSLNIPIGSPMIPSPGLPLTPPAEDTLESGLRRIDYFQDQTTTPTKIAVIGVGYVGVHLVQAFCEHYAVVALDLSPKRRAELVKQFANKSVEVTGDESRIGEATYILISVPTGLHHDNTIDTRHLESAISTVKRYARDGATVIIESSVAIGMTRQYLKPLMEARKIYGGMSPERVDPGRKLPHFQAIPKIISGLDDLMPGSLQRISKLYGAVFDAVVPVSSPEVAEMTKLYENCQRMMNIAFVNEMADACCPLGIDPFEVCTAASTKPFGYQPYFPGLGVGGHCIPVNPHYLLSTSDFPLLRRASETMSQRPSRMADQLVKRIRKTRPDANSKPRVLVVGVGFKKGQSVLSNSPGVQLIVSLLQDHECYVEFCDPLVSQEALTFVPKFDHTASWTSDALESQFDAVALVVDQVSLDLNILTDMESTILENFTAALPWLPIGPTQG